VELDADEAVELDADEAVELDADEAVGRPCVSGPPAKVRVGGKMHTKQGGRQRI